MMVKSTKYSCENGFHACYGVMHIAEDALRGVMLYKTVGVGVTFRFKISSLSQ